MYKEYSGGLAAELLSHQMDFINWAFDTHPTQITTTGWIDFYKDGRETFDNVKIKGTKGMVSLLINDGIYYPDKEVKKEWETVDGVTVATKIEWNTDGGIVIEADKSKDGTWHALKDFYDCIQQKREPTSDVITGDTTAFCVHLANQAMYNKNIQNWQPEYNLV
jgi:predicted dehydrogenase